MINETQEKPILIYQKTADPQRNRVIIPKTFIDRYGKDFSMEVYKDKIILKPIKNKEE
jgi:hypothetical protein